MFYCEKLKLTCKSNTNSLQVVLTLLFRFRFDILVRESWINVPMVIFVLFGLGPYGMALDFRYQSVNLLIETVNFKAQAGNNTNHTIKLLACPEVSTCALCFKCQLLPSFLRKIRNIRKSSY